MIVGLLMCCATFAWADRPVLSADSTADRLDLLVVAPHSDDEAIGCLHETDVLCHHRVALVRGGVEHQVGTRVIGVLVGRHGGAELELVEIEQIDVMTVASERGDDLLGDC